MQYATLDDSTVHKDGIYVYSHALVIDEIPYVIIFSGDKKSVFQHEEGLMRFIKDHLGDSELYACSHYFHHYPKIASIASEINRVIKKDLPKSIQKSFCQSDEEARRAAWSELERIVSTNKIMLNEQNKK